MCVCVCLSVCLYLLCVYYHNSIFTLDQVHIKWVCWHLMMLSSYLFPQPVLTEFEYIMWLYQEKRRIQTPRKKQGWKEVPMKEAIWARKSNFVFTYLICAQVCKVLACDIHAFIYFYVLQYSAKWRTCKVPLKHFHTSIKDWFNELFYEYANLQVSCQKSSSPLDQW